MNIYLTRHGQTELNRHKRMQGRIDIPLNETGIAQAQEARRKTDGIPFDAVYASPLSRAVKTAEIIGNVSTEEITTDPRIIETDFGKYDGKKYYLLGPRMTLFWALPELFPAPPTVESVDAMKERVTSFLEDLNKKDHKNVLIVCHGGIIRVLTGCLLGVKRGYVWRPKPKNCEIRKFTI